MLLKRLFELKRCPDPGSVVLTIFYFPFGLVLVVIRLFIVIHALLVSCILPKSQATSFILKSLFGVVGIQVMVQEDQRKKCPENLKPKIVVTNHVSYLDHMVVDLIQPVITPDEVGFSSFYRWLFSYTKFGIEQGKECLENNIKKYLQDSTIPVLFHPEGTPTNGTGILKFRTFPFSLDVPVLPISIQATRWPLTVPVSTIYSSRLSEFFWSLFYPYTIYKLRLLEPQVKKESDTVEAFAEHIRKMISTSLGIPATNYTAADKMEYLKRLIADQAQQARQAAQSRQGDNGSMVRNTNENEPINISPEVKKMAEQVQAVLPDSPMSLIIQDLESTRDVDVTITNILEGKVKEGKKPEVKSSSKIDRNIETSVCASQQKYKSNSFGRTAPERQLSLEERKKIMIATARQRYKEKHGLL